MIDVRELSKDYGVVQALRGITFSVERGQVVGLLGPNGAGKSTAMRIITGYLAPSGGSVQIDGREVIDDPIPCQRKIGYLPEGNPLYLDMRLRESLRFAADMRGLRGEQRRRAIGEAVEVSGLRGKERMLIGNLSKGFRQRVGLAQALLHEPSILILDEPTSGLDPNQQEEMRALIRNLGNDRTVVLSTHVLPEVEAVCSRVLIISKGKLAADGTVAEIKAQSVGEGTVLVSVRGDMPAAQQAFSALPFVLSVDVDTASRPEIVNVRARVREQIDSAMLEAVAAAAHENGLPLSHLGAREASLEQVFAQLTEFTRPAQAGVAGGEGQNHAS